MKKSLFILILFFLSMASSLFAEEEKGYLLVQKAVKKQGNRMIRFDKGEKIPGMSADSKEVKVGDKLYPGERVIIPENIFVDFESSNGNTLESRTHVMFIVGNISKEGESYHQKEGKIRYSVKDILKKSKAIWFFEVYHEKYLAAVEGTIFAVNVDLENNEIEFAAEDGKVSIERMFDNGEGKTFKWLTTLSSRDKENQSVRYRLGIKETSEEFLKSNSDSYKSDNKEKPFFRNEKKREPVKKEVISVKKTRKSETPVKKGTDFTNSLGMKFVYIPPGTFMMGSPLDEPGRYDNETLHQVTLTSGFYMQTTEVTQGQWKAVMGDNPSHFKDCGDNCPVERVSWNNVQEFINKLNQIEKTDKYRLPTEAEWEYACRAGTTTAYNWGDFPDCSKANYRQFVECKNRKPETMKVGSFAPNEWGLYDMHGNVWEWCQDWYGDYPAGAVTDPAGPVSTSNRLLRGGYWNGVDQNCRSASRFSLSPGVWLSTIGVRLALFPSQQ